MAPEDFKRKLTAVYSADVVGYSRLMGEDESATVKTLETYKGVMFTLIKQHRGRVIDSPGDNLLAEFGSVVEAVQCAVAVQKELQARNADLPINRRMQFRIGINLGDVIEEKERLYGDGVNIAARLEALAEPGGICISKTAFDHIESKLPLGYKFLGEQTVKNIAKPVGAYKVLMETRVIDEEEKHEAEINFLWRKKGILSVGIIVVLSAIAALFWTLYLHEPPIGSTPMERMAYPLPDKPSIAVLPFTNMSGDSKQEYFSDGITEDLITGLSKISGLFVIARNSVFIYKGKAVKIAEVGRELGVRYILEGSIRKSGDRVRITAQLIDANTEGHLWAERYDRELKDIFLLQDEVTNRIVSALAVKITEDDRLRLIRKGTDNLEAYDYTLRGLEYFSQITRNANAQARQMFEKAIDLDPDYALAYSLVGGTHMMEWSFGWSQDPQSVGHAFELTQKALRLDDSLHIAHQVMGDVYLWKKQHEKAISSYRKAIALDPNDADGYYGLGNVLNWAGRPEEASKLIKKAMRLNPMYPVWYLWVLGQSHFLKREHKEAINIFSDILHRNPNFLPAHPYLAAIYHELDRKEEARLQAEKLVEKSPHTSLDAWKRRLPYKNQEDLDRLYQALQKIGIE